MNDNWVLLLIRTHTKSCTIHHWIECRDINDDRPANRMQFSAMAKRKLIDFSTPSLQIVVASGCCISIRQTPATIPLVRHTNVRSILLRKAINLHSCLSFALFSCSSPLTLSKICSHVNDQFLWTSSFTCFRFASSSVPSFAASTFCLFFLFIDSMVLSNYWVSSMCGL